jgi:hypothetical protein
MPALSLWHVFLCSMIFLPPSLLLFRYDTEILLDPPLSRFGLKNYKSYMAPLSVSIITPPEFPNPSMLLLCRVLCNHSTHCGRLTAPLYGCISPCFNDPTYPKSIYTQLAICFGAEERKYFFFLEIYNLITQGRNESSNLSLSFSFCISTD